MINLRTVKSILLKHYDLRENPTFIFGSRSNDSNRPDSDLDILIDDKTITPDIVSRLDEAFEESDLTYKVDIILRTRIDDSFYLKIAPDLKKI
ncbi:MAG: nucleotidyltransferase domain-containing protein [Halobacteriovoraceae bacterium]|jgi:uncharacterized protein|nr:nucleotidyltransferase domain-containing protein [Halobacteriovoraceae bacterium]